jgi:hypothetical protein
VPPAPRASRSLVARWAAGLAACALALTAPLTGSVPPASATAAEAAAPVADSGTDPGGDAPATQDGATPDTPHVVLDEVTPWLDRDGAVTVTGRIVNPTASDFAPTQLSVVRSASRMSMRDDVGRWVEQQTSAHLLVSADRNTQQPTPEPDDTANDPTDDEDEGPQLELPQLPDTVAPGQQTDFSFTIPADQALPGGSADSTWGAYGLGVTLAGTAQQESVLHTAPGFTVWYPDPGIDATRLTTVLPVTLDAVPEDGGPLIPADVLERAADPEATGDHAGSLDRLLASARSLPDSVLAVDPRLLVSVAAALDVAPDAQAPTDDPEAVDPEDADDPVDQDPGDGNGANAGSDTGPQDSAADDGEGSGGDADGDGEGASAEPDATLEPTAPGEDAREAHPQLAAWYDELLDVAQSHDTIALPWADAHLTALWHAGMDDLAQNSLDERDLITGLLGARSDIVWPAAGTVRTEDLGRIADADAGAVILSDSQAPSVTSYTSSANSAVSVDGTPSAGGAVDTSDAPELSDQTQPRVLQSLVADSGLAEAAAGHTAASGSTAPGQFLALSAAVTAERPYDSRALLLTLPRTSTGSGHAAFARSVAGAPWIEDTSLDTLMSTEPVARGQLVDPETLVDDGSAQSGSAEDGAAQDGTQQDSSQQDRTGVQQPDEEGARADAESDQQARSAESVLSGLQQRYTTGEAASHAFVDAAGVERDMARSLLACTAGGWVDDLVDGVKPEPGSSVLLVTGEQAMIPVRVDNATDRTARVRLRVESPTPQLSTELSDIVTLGPGEARSVDVPVRGLANADVRSTVTLLTVDGDALPQRTELLVRVRADWENTATIAIGSVLVVVLVVGLVATIRRGRRKIPENQLAAAMARAQDG